MSEDHNPSKFHLRYLVEGRKLCSTCNIEKPNSEFYRRGGKEGLGETPKLRSNCKECHHLIVNKRGAGTQESRDKYNLDKRKRSENYRRVTSSYVPGALASERRKIRIRDSALRFNYGINLDDFNKMKEEQNGCCFICKIETPNLCVDHCHSTGTVRKLLCSRCNLGLGMLGENVETIKNMLDYIKTYTNKGD